MKLSLVAILVSLSLGLVLACSSNPDAVGDQGGVGSGAKGSGANGGSSGGSDGKGASTGSGGIIIEGGGGLAGSNGNGGNGNVCEKIELDASSTPPRVLIVQDLSSSMKGQWQPLDDAMVSIVAEFGDRMALGYVGFSSIYLDNVEEIVNMTDDEFDDFFDDWDNDCNISEESIIVPALGNQAAVTAAYDAVVPELMVGGTPTNLAMTRAYEILVDGDPDDGSKGYAILLTDGAPNCNAGGVNGVETKVGNLAAEGVGTYVVGYNYDGDALGDWAQAGNTGDYYDASDTESLNAAMTGILDDLIPCDYELSSPVKDPSFVRVTIDGEDRALDNAENGWSLGDDGVTVSLTGEACTDLRAAGDHTIDVVVECAKVIVYPK